MPQRYRNNPDWHDVKTITDQLWEDYNVATFWSVRIRGDKVELIGKTVPAPFEAHVPPAHVALVSFPVFSAPDMVVKMFTVAFDLWCQHDGAGATAAVRGASHDWSGRVEMPRRRR